MKRTKSNAYEPVAFRLTKPPEQLTIWEGFDLWREHHLVDKDGSPDTVENYRSDLKKFVRYLEAKGIKPLLHLVTEDIIRAFIMDYQEKENPAPNTLYRLKACLKSMFSYLARKGYIPSDPTQEIKIPRAGRKVKRTSRVIPLEVRIKLAKCALAKGLREYLMFCLANVYAPRPEQLRELRWTDVDFANQFIRFPPVKRSGAGGGPLCEELLELIKDFKEGGYGGKEYVFRSRQGEPISEKRMKKIMDELLKGNFPVKEYTFHDLRTTVATEISQRPGCNTRVVQEILGHRRAETTVGYERADLDIMKEVVRERFQMIDVRPKFVKPRFKADVAAASQPQKEQENRKENSIFNLKPPIPLSPEMHLPQIRDLACMFTLAPFNLFQSAWAEREYKLLLERLSYLGRAMPKDTEQEYKLLLEALLSFLRSNTGSDGDSSSS